MNPSAKTINNLIEFAHNQLNRIIIPFWEYHLNVNDSGIFPGSVDTGNLPDRNAPVGLIMNARVLWTFSALYSYKKKPAHIKIAHNAYRIITQYFYDNLNNGYYWSIDSNGNVVDRKKQIYAQAFVIYGLSEYYNSTGNAYALEKAKELLYLLEEIAYDTQNNGYFEAFSGNWELAEDSRLSEKDMNEKKTMNTHLHILEAYTNLYKVWNNSFLKTRIKNLLQIFESYIIDPGTYHFNLFFDEKWKIKSNKISYGHDIEGSWLLYEAAAKIKNHRLSKEYTEIAVRIAESVIPAINPDGGIPYEYNEKLYPEGEFEWWVQAEGIVGLINVFQITGNNKYLSLAKKLSEFTGKYFVDKKYGEWYFRLDKEKKPILSYEKAGFWKCPYHNTRMCIEIINRLNVP